MASFNIQVWWYVNGVAIVILGALQLHAKRLPQIVQDALLYGKTRGQRKEGTLMRLVEVPKKQVSIIELRVFDQPMNSQISCTM